jgi:Tfp pilus assembly protein PilZ
LLHFQDLKSIDDILNFKKMKALFSFLFLVFVLHANAQNVTILPGGITPAMSGTYPRISYDAIVALPSPVKGDMAYDITFDCLRVYNGTKWVCTFQHPTDPNPNAIAIASSGGTGIEYGSAIALDASGNMYITGNYYATTTIGSISLTSAGDSDIFVAKYNSAGTLQWVQSAGGTGSDFGFALALDASGNVYITGNYAGTATFGTTSKTSLGNYDIFVAKYNSAGTVQWVQSAGGTSNDVGQGIALDASGNVYITGAYQGMATFSTTTKTSAGSYDIFVAKYNSAGTVQWVQSAGGTNSDEGRDIALDASGNVYITGYYQGMATFGTTSKTSTGSYDIFVAKYDPVGISWTWVQSAGGTTDDIGQGIALDASGNVYITGTYQGMATFSTTTKTSLGGSYDIFVAKYNSAGTVQWVQSAGGTGSDFGFAIALDASGNVYITGYYLVTATFGSTTKTSAGSSDIFVAKFNSAGTVQWVQSAGGTSQDEGVDIALAASGNVYVTGYYYNTASFGYNTKTASGGNPDMFIMRLSQ